MPAIGVVPRGGPVYGNRVAGVPPCVPPRRGTALSRPHEAGLEVLSRQPDGPAHATPLLFVHGAYAAAWCWDEHFLPYFARSGYASHAVSLSGHGRSRGRQRLDTLSIADYVSDVREAVEALSRPPVLIGHSMGGMVIQKFLEQPRCEVAAAVLMASVPPQGLWSSAFGLALGKPGLMRDLNHLLGGGRVALESLRSAMFSQPIDAQRLREYYRRMQPESYRAIWDMTLFDLPRPREMHRPPMLVLGAEHDPLIPAALVKMTAATYGVEAEIFPGMGHGMMLERDWEAVARRIVCWLDALGL